jgi:DNA-binding NarL/FixJ family response regulator
VGQILEATRVLVGDDAPTRAGLRQVLEAGGFVVCAEAGDAAGAVDAAVRERPDVCVVAMEMPGSGIAATAQITAKLPGARVVVLTSSGAEADFLDSLRAGAIGYLPKSIAPASLTRALRGVAAGEAALSRRLVATLVEEYRRRGRSRRFDGAQLTRREWDVLELLREGLSTAQIASRLFVAPETVRTHVSALVRKLRVTDRKALVRLLRKR